LILQQDRLIGSQPFLQLNFNLEIEF